MFKELCVLSENGGAKRNVYMGLIGVYVEGLLRLVLLAGLFVLAYMRFTWTEVGWSRGVAAVRAAFLCLF